MRGAALASLPWLVLLALVGCASNPYAASQTKALQQQQVTLQQRNQELQSRAGTLDADNQELQAMLAQTRQQGKLLDDQLSAVREQLSAASTQLSQLRQDKQLSERQVEALATNARRRAGAIITANSSLRRDLPAMNMPGVEVREDGDVVRIELPTAKLFQPGGTALLPAAGTLLTSVAAELSRSFPEQIIGIEGHTDSDPLRSPQGADNQQFSTLRALAVYQYLSTSGLVPANQLFTVGHAGNHPVVSNATPSGKQRNNRVELVVYPEKAIKR